MSTATRPTTADLAEDLQRLIQDSEAYQQAAGRQADLLGKLSSLESEFERLQKAGSDVERNAAKLAGGQKVDFRKDDRRLESLAREIESHRLAIAQADSARKQVLSELSRQGCAELAPLHREHVRELVDTFHRLDELWRTADAIPRVLKRAGMVVTNDFPLNGRDQWEAFASHRLTAAIQALEMFLDSTRVKS